MKLAKQIILLSAAFVLCMGLSFTLISGIVIGSQTSIKDAKLEQAIIYQPKLDAANKTRDDAIKAADQTKATALTAAEALEGEAKTAAIKKANDDYKATVAAAKKTRDTTVTEARRTRDQEIAEARKAAFHAAFYYSKTTSTLTDAGQRTGTSQAFTPMGCLMVSGLAMTFIGGGLVLTVVLLNKNEAKKQPTQTKKAA